jgi:hypothetical protein
MSRRRQARRAQSQGVPIRYVIGGLALLVLLVAGAAALLVGGGSGAGSAGFTAVPAGYAYPVQAIERSPDRSHFPVGQTYDAYSTDPPTSGPHAATPATWGVHDEPVAREQAVHNMEHGGAVVWYNCNASAPLDTNGCTQLRNELTSVVQAAIGSGTSFVMMTPYTEMDHRIALTAWGFLDEFDEFEQERIQAFLSTFECNFNVEKFCS